MLSKSLTRRSQYDVAATPVGMPLRLRPYVRAALASRQPLSARFAFTAGSDDKIVETAEVQERPACGGPGLSGDGGVDRDTSRSDDRVPGPIRNDDRGRRGPCDRD